MTQQTTKVNPEEIADFITWFMEAELHQMMVELKAFRGLREDTRKAAIEYFGSYDDELLNSLVEAIKQQGNS
jgi:hypothetical protein